MRRVETKTKFFPLFFLVLILINAISVSTSADTISGEKYDIVVYQSSSSGMGNMIIIISSGYLASLPLQAFLSYDCNSSMSLHGLQTIPPLFNISLNDTEYVVEVIFEVYHGCSKTNARLVDIKKEYIGDGRINIVAKIYAPLIVNETTPIMLSINVRRVEFIYRYVNDSYFELDMNLKGLVPGQLEWLRIAYTKHLDEYSVSYRFLVDKYTWQAVMWNGTGWTPVGVIPLAGPALNVSSILKNLYENYKAAAEYYLNNPEVLNQTILKIKNYYKNNESDKASKYINNITISPMPRELKQGVGLQYMNYGYGHNILIGESFSKKFINYTVSNRTDYIVNAYITSSLQPLLKDAIKEYLQNGTTRSLEYLVAQYNGFLRIPRIYNSSGYSSNTPVIYVGNTPPLTSYFTLALPKIGLEHPYNISYEVIVLDVGLENGEFIYNASLDDVIQEYGTNASSIAIIAIDHRLAREFTLSNLEAFIDRRGLLYSLVDKVLWDYRLAWYYIVSGMADPRVALNSFIENLTISVAAVAVQLGGKEALETLGIELSQSTDNSTQNSQESFRPGTVEETNTYSRTSEDKESTDQGSIPTDSTTLIYIGAAIIIVAVGILVYSIRVKGSGF